MTLLDKWMVPCIWTHGWENECHIDDDMCYWINPIRIKDKGPNRTYTYTYI